jgi:hypothetical protein
VNYFVVYTAKTSSVDFEQAPDHHQLPTADSHLMQLFESLQIESMSLDQLEKLHEFVAFQHQLKATKFINSAAESTDPIAVKARKGILKRSKSTGSIYGEEQTQQSENTWRALSGRSDGGLDGYKFGDLSASTTNVLSGGFHVTQVMDNSDELVRLSVSRDKSELDGANDSPFSKNSEHDGANDSPFRKKDSELDGANDSPFSKSSEHDGANDSPFSSEDEEVTTRKGQFKTNPMWTH